MRKRLPPTLLLLPLICIAIVFTDVSSYAINSKIVGKPSTQTTEGYFRDDVSLSTKNNNSSDEDSSSNVTRDASTGFDIPMDAMSNKTFTSNENVTSNPEDPFEFTSTMNNTETSMSSEANSSTSGGASSELNQKSWKLLSPNPVEDVSSSNDSDASIPASNGSDASMPASNGSDASMPDSNGSDASMPASNGSDASVPASNESDASMPASNGSDASVPASNGSDASMPASNGSDASMPDNNGSDASMPASNGSEEETAANDDDNEEGEDIMAIILKANEDVPEGKLWEGDIEYVDLDTSSNAVTGSARSNQSKNIKHCGPGSRFLDPQLWPVENNKVIIPYVFDWVTPAPQNEAKMNTAINYLNRILSPRFEWKARTNEKSYVNITNPRAQSCSSKLGLCHEDFQPQRLNIGTGCKHIGTLAHEMFHTMGYPHEQSRWDRDSFVEIKRTNIKPKKFSQFRLMPKPANYPDQLQANGPRVYDYHSVMHYPKFAFAYSGLDSIVPLTAGVKIGQRIGPSKRDVQEMHVLYGFPAPAIGNDDCDFDSANSWCMYTHSSSWSIHGQSKFAFQHFIKGAERADPDFEPPQNNFPKGDHTYGYGRFAKYKGDNDSEPNEIVGRSFDDSSPTYCVTFAYYMHPKTSSNKVIGTLKVLVRSDDGSEQTLFTKTGDQGNQWKIGQVTMSTMDQPHRIVIRAEKAASGQNGDISIDDIFFDEGNCPPPQQPNGNRRSHKRRTSFKKQSAVRGMSVKRTN